MAGHAPEILTPTERLQRWLAESSDVRLSLYMLVIAAVVVGAVLVVDRGLLG